MKHILFTLAIIFSIMYLQSCKRSQAITHKPIAEFSKHITGYTSNMISVNGKINIELADAIIDSNNNKNLNELPDSNLIKDVFSISPKVKGKAIWTSNRTIEFVPNEPLEPQQVYAVTFHLNKLKKVESKFKKMVFDVATFKPSIKVDGYYLQSMDGYHLQYMSLYGSAILADAVDKTALQKTVLANIDGKKIKLYWQKQSFNSYTFSADSILRNNKKQTVNLQWNGKAIGAIEKGDAHLMLRSIEDFEIENCEVIDNEEKATVEITCSDPLLKNQNLDGLITISNHKNLKYTIEKNKIFVYINELHFGESNITINKNIKNKLSYGLKENFTQAITFNKPNPKVMMINGGNILPNSQGLFLPFKSIGLKAVDVRIIKIFENNIHQFLQINDLDGSDGLKRVGTIIAEEKVNLTTTSSFNTSQWTTHVLDLNKWIKPSVGAIYRVSIQFNKKYTDCDCATTIINNDSDEAIEMDEINVNDIEEMNDENWHGRSFDNGYNTYEDYNNTYNPCEENYYDGMAISKNILASDIGIIYKQDNYKNAFIYTSNMLSSAPMRNTKIEIYNYVKQIIAQGHTDANGMLQLKIPEQAFLLIAKQNNQRGYLKVTNGNNNSLTKFDVEGSSTTKNIKGYIYAERGVWRPGDSMFINFMLQDKLHALPTNHPITFILEDVNGRIIQQTTKTENLSGIYDFRTATASSATTGYYTAIVKVGNEKFTKNILIETIKPNRLKINHLFSDSLITIANINSKNTLKAQWLHGAIAKNCKANIVVKYFSHTLQFAHLKNYCFNNETATSTTDEYNVFDGPLNDSGSIAYKFQTAKNTQLPALIKLQYTTKVFEPSGEYSIDQSQQMYAPYASYVGLYKDDKPFKANEKYTFKLANVNALGQAIAHNQVRLKVYKLTNEWWYQEADDNFSDYITRQSTELDLDTIIKIQNGSAEFNFQTFTNKGALYLFSLEDVNSNHVCKQKIYFNANYNSNGATLAAENASMLSLQTNKTTYQVGEKIIVNIPSMSNAHALVSIENSSGVLHSTWIKTTTGITEFSFTATKEMLPNMYIHVSLIQAHANTLNDLPMRLYGVVPITVDDESSHILPIINCAESIKPQTNATLNVQEKNGHAMYYTLAMVDEGLLDITHFKTPDAWNTFNAKEAIGVRTWDVYDNVIGAYSGRLDRMLQIGGDGSFDDAYENKAQRFKPVVLNLGTFFLPANTSKTHSFILPNYMGSVRVMIVAKSEIAYGSASKNIVVKKPLMLLSTLPRSITVGEKITVPIQIFCTDKNIKDVNITMTHSNLLSSHIQKQSLHFNAIGDEIINFQIEVKNQIGIAHITFNAQGNNETAFEAIEMAIRVPNSQMKESNSFTILPNTNLHQNLALKGLQGGQNLKIEISNYPLTNIGNRLEYLITYPHGCVEQTTSAAFAQLYLNALIGVDSLQQKNINKNIQDAIYKLQLFQTNSGGFAYWQGENTASDFGTSYTTHFLLEADRNGFNVPKSMLNNAIQYQKNEAKNWEEEPTMHHIFHYQESNAMIQAYRLYTLALNNTSDLGAMNKLYETKNIGITANAYLAMCYTLNGKMAIAQQLANTIVLSQKPFQELSFAYSSDTRDEAIVLQCYSLLNDNKKVGLAKNIVAKLNNKNSYNTQEIAYSLISLANYYGISNTSIKIDCATNINGKAQNIKTNKQNIILDFKAQHLLTNNNIDIKNNASHQLYVNITQSYFPTTADTLNVNKTIAMKVLYKNLNGKNIDIKNLQQGQDFIAEIIITNTSNSIYLKEMSLSYLIPSAWQILNNTSNNPNNIARHSNYRDNAAYFYYELQPNDTKIFTVLLNASYKGNFVQPNTVSESMYDENIFAKVGGGWVKVE